MQQPIHQVNSTLHPTASTLPGLPQSENDIAEKKESLTTVRSMLQPFLYPFAAQVHAH